MKVPMIGVVLGLLLTTTAQADPFLVIRQEPRTNPSWAKWRN